MKTSCLNRILFVLILEKIVQHIFVTLTFALNWMRIRSTVAINPDILFVAGAFVAILFGLSLWGMLTRQTWAINLVIVLALFDIIGEFVAQGTPSIMITVSFLVALMLLLLALVERRQARKLALTKSVKLPATVHSIR